MSEKKSDKKRHFVELSKGVLGIPAGGRRMDGCLNTVNETKNCESEVQKYNWAVATQTC